ncbi:hypothetical protein EGK_02771, partial [Macaca mulatta]
AGNQRLQQVMQAADPLEIQADVHWTHIREREEEERMAPASESSASRAPLDENDLEEDVDSEPAEIEGEAAEDGDPGDTGAELDDDQHWSDSPSDADRELHLRHAAEGAAEPELRVSEDEEKLPASPKHQERGPSQATSPIQSAQESALLFTPVHSPSTEGPRLPPVPAATRETLPEERLFPEPLLPKEKPKADAPSDPKAVHSPIRSQPVALPEARTPASPGSPQPRPPVAASTPPPSPLPICSQPQPSTEAAVPSPTQSPIRFQPVPAKTSTPLAPLPVQSQSDTKDRLGSPLAVDEALRRSDLVEEFWMKSAEIRRSLGLTPVDRSKGPEPSFPTPAFRPVSLKSYSVEKSSQDEGLHLLKPLSVPKRLGLPKPEGEPLSLPTPRSPSDRELRSAQEERRELSSSSGLGLHGSSSNMKTLGSQSFNTSDSAMLTPPKSFVESVEEIPFADDVEDTYDDKTEDSSLQEKFFTPPSCWPRSGKPPHPPLGKENGRLPAREGALQPQKRGLPLVSAEAKELAEERMRAREKSVKSQALRDAMARQLSRMQQMELATGAPRPRKASSAPSQGKERRPDSPTRPTLRGSEEPTLKHEAISEEVLSAPSDSGGPDGSFTSSEGSSGKSKKRSSLFSPRRNKKEKKSKGEGRAPEKPSPNLLEEAATKPKSLWKSVFSGYKKDKKKKADDKSCPSTPSSGATVDSGKHRALPVVRAELQLRRQLSFSEDSDLSSDDVLERSSQKSRREPRTYTEEELNAKLTRRVQKAARRQAKQEELKRLHRAQIIQRQLQQVEERQRRLEERGVAVEKALRGEAGMGKKDDPKLMQEWFKLVQEKNAMVRYESELMIFARELELEDRQSRLQQELRERMAVEDHLKTEEELSEEKQILNEMLEVVEQRDSLVALLEEQRLREREEDKDLEAAMLSKGFSLNWS